jgi:hypothetical protein
MALLIGCMRRNLVEMDLDGALLASKLHFSKLMPEKMELLYDQYNRFLTQG